MFKKIMVAAVIVFFTSLPVFSLAYLGSRAPSLKLPDIDKNIFDLASLKGQKKILVFWASWSEPALLELIFLGKNYSSLKNKNYEIVAVNLDQKPAVASFFAERYKLDFPVLVDLNLISLDRYQVLVVPSTFFINEAGRITQVLVNFNEQVAENFKKIVKN